MSKPLVGVRGAGVGSACRLPGGVDSGCLFLTTRLNQLQKGGMTSCVISIKGCWVLRGSGGSSPDWK